MSSAKQFWIRLGLAFLFGLSVALVPLYLIVGDTDAIAHQQRFTQRQLKKTDVLLRDYRAKNGVYPPTLAAVGLEVWRDGWRRDFRYWLSGGVPLVESLGRDGVRGGIGLDADISNQNPNPPESVLPFSQKITDPLAQGMNIAALICGLFAGILFWSGLKNQSFERKTWPALGLSLLVAFVIAAYGALTITVFHVPSGH